MKRDAADLGLAQRVANEIRLRIVSGELGPGDRIPTLAALRSGGVSVSTARAAHDLLREWGLVSGGQGAALKVRIPHRPIVHSSVRHGLEKGRVMLPEDERRGWGAAEHELGLSVQATGLMSRYARIAGPAGLVEVLGVEPGTELLARSYQMRDANTGYLAASSVSYLPVALIAGNPRLFDEGEEPWPGGTMHQLFTVGIELAQVIERIGARPPIADERQSWGMERGDVLLTVRRLSIDVQGRVVEVSDAEYPAGRTMLESVTELPRWDQTSAGL